MNFTPAMIEKHHFRRTLFRGYDQGQVNDFLAKVADDIRECIARIDQLKNQLSLAEGKVRHYRSIEESLQHTLLLAQNAGETIKANACDKAANIIKEAELQAQKIISEANQEVQNFRHVAEELKRNLLSFRSKTESLIRAQLELVSRKDDEAVGDPAG
jgi:cell division initiation protein